MFGDPLLKGIQQKPLTVPGAQYNQNPQISKPQDHIHLLATTAGTAYTERSPHFHYQYQHCVTIFHNQMLAYVLFRHSETLTTLYCDI